MSRITRRSACTLLALAAFVAPGLAAAQAQQESQLLKAATVLDELRSQRDTLIPERLLQRAYGVAVIPDVKKVALVIGGRRGSGVLTVRDSRGRFTAPVFINLTGGSVGWQIGAQETDVVLVFTTREGVEGLADGKITLGGSASVAAGPVGRQAEAAAGTNAEVFAYSRNRGLFAGVALDGTGITIDDRGNRAFYGKRDVLASQIMNGTVTTDSQNSSRFLAALARSTGESADAPVMAAPTAQPQPGAPATPPPVEEGVRTFPMEDTAPGAEPPR